MRHETLVCKFLISRGLKNLYIRGAGQTQLCEETRRPLYTHKCKYEGCTDLGLCLQLIRSISTWPQTSTHQRRWANPALQRDEKPTVHTHKCKDEGCTARRLCPQLIRIRLQRGVFCTLLFNDTWHTLQLISQIAETLLCTNCKANDARTRIWSYCSGSRTYCLFCSGCCRCCEPHGLTRQRTLSGRQGQISLRTSPITLILMHTGHETAQALKTAAILYNAPVHSAPCTPWNSLHTQTP